MKHHSEAIDYSNLNFEAIQKEMMADEDTERAKADGQAEGKGPKDAQATSLDEPLTNPLIDQATNPNVINLAV